MAKLLFKLGNVPEDEAEEIRALLKQHEYAFYETTAGNWGVSLAGIWLNDPRDFEVAKQLIAQYQKDRLQKVREEYNVLRKEGKVDSLFTRFKRQPLAFVFIVGVVVFVGYFSVVPFLNFLQ